MYFPGNTADPVLSIIPRQDNFAQQPIEGTSYSETPPHSKKFSPETSKSVAESVVDTTDPVGSTSRQNNFAEHPVKGTKYHEASLHSPKDFFETSESAAARSRDIVRIHS